MSLVVPRPDVEKTCFHFLFASHEDIVPLGKLRVTHLLVNVTLGAIQLDFVAQLVQVEVNSFTVVHSLLRNGANDGLPGRKPERPLSSQVLAEDGEETLNGAQNCSVDDNRATEARLERHLVPREGTSIVLIGGEFLRGHLLLGLGDVLEGSLLFCSVFMLILEVKAEGLLEVDLNGTALVLSAQRIVDLDIDLGTIEGSITVVESPGLTELDESFLEGSLSLIPLLLRAESVVRPRRQLELVGKAEDAINVFEEVQTGKDLLTDLFCRAEDVSIILLEATNTNETTEGARDLVTVKNAEISVAERKVTVAVDAMFEHNAMSRAVHGLETRAVAVLALEEEHVVLVVLIMTT